LVAAAFIAIGVAAVIAAVLVVVADLGHDERPTRRWIEGLVPLIGVAVLVVWTWMAR